MSGVPVELCVGGRDLTEPRLSPDGRYLLYAVSEAGSAWLAVDGGEPLATSPSLRSGRGMGGGAWWYLPDSSGVVYVGSDGDLWRQQFDGGAAMQLTHHAPDRAASSPVVAPDGSFVAYVLDLAEVWSTPFDGSAPVRLDDGSAAFCIDPTISPQTHAVAWQAWNDPDMPWDSSRIDSPQGTLLRADGAVQQARFAPDGSLLAIRDDRGWLNVWRDDAPVLSEAFEHAGPTWGPGQCSYALSPDGTRLAFTRNERGFGRLCVVDLSDGSVRDIGRGVHGQISWHGHRIAALRSGARTPTQVVWYHPDGGERTVVAVGPSSEWLEPQALRQLVEPEVVEIAVPHDDGVVHARLYAADEPDGRLIVWLHGGPTDQWQVSFMPRVAYWRSRGWSILVPDHRGSTGHGRDYQQALRGRWGDLDVTETIAATTTAHERGWGSAPRTVVIGGSAGGFTALGALAASPQTFAAGIVLYPVTDLADLAARSHRFEQHYTDSLVGPLPASAARYVERSPIHFAERLVGTPLLMLHGDADPVVPVEQSRQLADRLRAAGGTVDLHIYEGEGHGFRQRANQIDEYERIGRFLDRYVPIASPT